MVSVLLFSLIGIPGTSCPKGPRAWMSTTWNLTKLWLIFVRRSLMRLSRSRSIGLDFRLTSGRCVVRHLMVSGGLHSMILGSMQRLCGLWLPNVWPSASLLSLPSRWLESARRLVEVVLDVRPRPSYLLLFLLCCLCLFWCF